MRVGFLELSHVFANQIKIPYSTGCVWSYCRADPEIKHTFDLNDWFYVLDDKFDVHATAEQLSECDVVGVSHFVWNASTNDRVCKEIKRFNPDCKIVYGGLGTPKYGRCTDFLNERPYIDAIVHNEGEVVFSNLLKHEWSTVDGITTHEYVNPLQDRIKDISVMPSPYLDGLFDQLPDMPWECLVEPVRGCPYTCTFCEIGDKFYTKISKQNREKLYREIDWVSDRQIEYLHIVDNNFGMVKDHKEVADYLIDKFETTGYPNALNISWAKHKKPFLFDMAEDLWRAGLNKSMTLALQSMNDDTLRAVERTNENTNLEQVIEYCKSKGMPAYIETIMGLPEETLESFKNGIYKLIDDYNYHNYIGIYFMVALPNTPFGDPEYLKKYGIQLAETAPCFFHHEHPEKLMEDTNQIVVGSNAMPYSDFLEACGWKWFMMTFHFLGWTRLIALEQPTCRTFYTYLFDWAMVNRGFIYEEYMTTMDLMDQVFDHKIPWGRKVEGAGDTYWEYEEATSIEIAKNKSQFYDEMFSFMGDYDLIEKQSMAMREPGDDLEKYARECLWWGRRAEKFFNSTEI